MAIDFLILLCLWLFGVVGLRSGTVNQMASWVGIVFGKAVSKPLAFVLTLALARDLGFPPVGVRVGLSVFCFYTLSVLGTIVVRSFLKQLAGRRLLSPADKAGGFLLGVGRGGVLLFVLLSLALFFEKPLAGAFHGPPDVSRDSVLVGYVRRHNVFAAAQHPELARVEKLMDAARSPASAQALSADPKLKAILADPQWNAALLDDKLAQAVKAGDWTALQEDPRIEALLKDPRLTGPALDPLDYDEK